eukprot:CAMPEP_0176098424 /NCGR_PEP_ID=MMETSP0120_2-20121206/49349_1 /TAXON_ID=160619 /ORGANISM="Kryptoperidinium foliaceum, Strain CCMP 1326" /LENGTH=156 /DNA_ID=CAMNT_0017432431 /DNA_START=65 /DNA_END=531 /DNA_ORIENTATION=+
MSEKKYQKVEDEDEDEEAGRRVSAASQSSAAGKSNTAAMSVEDSEPISEMESDSDDDFAGINYSDSETDDDEDEGEGLTEKKKTKKASIPLGPWKAELKKSVIGDVLPEDELQRVKWASVAGQFVLNSAAFGFFVGFVFVARIGAVASLFAYLSTV